MADIAGPGSTRSEPASIAAYGRPQALTWNIGTMGITTSRSLMASASAPSTIIVCSTIERWLESTPLGLPVVPEV